MAVLEAQEENKMSVADIVAFVSMIFMTITATFLLFNYINGVCVIIVLMWVLMAFSILMRNFFWKASWFVVSMGKKLIIHGEAEIERLNNER